MSKEITMESWKKELDDLREKSVSIIQLTEEQKEFLVYGRESGRAISWANLERAWKPIWGSINETTLAKRYRAMQENGEVEPIKLKIKE